MQKARLVNSALRLGTGVDEHLDSYIRRVNQVALNTLRFNTPIEATEACRENHLNPGNVVSDDFPARPSPGMMPRHTANG